LVAWQLQSSNPEEFKYAQTLLERVSKFRVLVNPWVAHQSDAHNCGVLTTMYLLYMAMQVGGFKNMEAWIAFPFKGAGGVGINPADNIHEIKMLSIAAFNDGKIWWALVKCID
jgi:hypothetical protein